MSTPTWLDTYSVVAVASFDTLLCIDRVIVNPKPWMHFNYNLVVTGQQEISYCPIQVLLLLLQLLLLWRFAHCRHQSKGTAIYIEMGATNGRESVNILATWTAFKSWQVSCSLQLDEKRNRCRRAISKRWQIMKLTEWSNAASNSIPITPSTPQLHPLLQFSSKIQFQ